jgi:hypothetical protein
VATLATAGVVDDARTALRRAERLAERGWGDEAVAARLTGEGFGAEDVRLAVQALAPERERAAALAAAAGDARAAWKLLVRRGFALETTEAAVGVLDGSR